VACPESEQIVIESEAGDFVERREGLVHEQDGGAGDQGARDGDAHLHAA
jgi:hypothetical protein